MKQHKFKLLISYDGTHFGGWQAQPNATSIQEHIQKALQTILRTSPITVVGSGRTDAGVHAEGQVAHFTAPENIDLYQTLRSLNALLPHEIRILDLSPVCDDFHARFSALGKIYHYHLHLDPITNPFNRLYTTYYPYPLDLSLIEEAIPHFVGEHNFTSFANDAHLGSASKKPVRTLHRLEMVSVTGGIRLDFEGAGFLYKMVRNITGTLLDVGGGKIPPDAIPKILEAKDRRQAGHTAPPQGLFLMKVLYHESQLEGISKKESKCEMLASGLK